MPTLEQVEDSAKGFETAEPFSLGDQAAPVKAAAALKGVSAVSCTNRRYCVKERPQDAKTPETSGLLNLDLTAEGRALAKGLYSWRAVGGRASSCIACGTCEAMCPQGIGIVDRLEAATALLAELFPL